MIVEGALDSTETFSDTQAGRLAQASYLGDLERDAKRESFTAEVFILFHDHEMSGEDEDVCAQYVTDHHPDYVFGPDGPLPTH